MSETFTRLQRTLGVRDIALDQEESYSGPGISKMFNIPEDMEMLRLGRKNFPGNIEWVFGKGKGASAWIASVNHYSMLFENTEENLQNILTGQPFEVHYAGGIQEGRDGYIAAINAKTIRKHETTVETLVQLMPKRRVPKQQFINLRVGTGVVEGVLTSNEDDNALVTIYGDPATSSLFYDAITGAFEPEVYRHWPGKQGWTGSASVDIIGDQLFINDEAGRFRIDFHDKGYTIVGADKLEEAAQ
ncbi:hypothetical protein CMO91_05140 [Candidatus Woesearchaeota archaeon]|nr:hypothetical protein [Candidatus Woesearchaeota archaeon]